MLIFVMGAASIK